MEGIASCSVSPSAILVNPNRVDRRHRCRAAFPFLSKHGSSSSPSSFLFRTSTRPSSVVSIQIRPRASAGDEDDDDDDGDEAEVVERALGMDGSIPASANDLIKRVSSRAYEMRTQLKNTIDSSSYDVLESNPWREYPKSLYVLTQSENQLCTMKTRRSRSEVEKELSLLFPKGGKRKSDPGKRSKQTSTGMKFRMLVEDVREGILVFEDEHDAARYCDLLQGGQGCEGIAEVDASSVFDICHKMRALAVLFRRGRTLPLPETLQLNLKARKRSLED